MEAGAGAEPRAWNDDPLIDLPLTEEAAEEENRLSDTPSGFELARKPAGQLG